MNCADAERLARQLMAMHGLTDWTFSFSRTIRRLGCCRLAFHQIKLSGIFVELNSEAEVRDVILHEIAHALTPLRGHDARWKAKAKEIGAWPYACNRGPINMPAMRYSERCPQCGIRHWSRRKRHPRPSFCYVCKVEMLPWEDALEQKQTAKQLRLF